MQRVARELDALYAGRRARSATRRCARCRVLECVIKETLRLHPPLIILMRKVQRDFHYKHWTVPAGKHGGRLAGGLEPHARVLPAIPSASIRRATRRRARRTSRRFAWIPFGGGRHRCVGAAFAMMQLKAIFSVLLRRFEFEMAQPPASYRNDHSKMVVQLEQPCRVRYRRRARDGGRAAARTARASESRRVGRAARPRRPRSVPGPRRLRRRGARGVPRRSEDEPGRAAAASAPPEALRARVEKAVRHCPTRALSIAGLTTGGARRREGPDMPAFPRARARRDDAPLGRRQRPRRRDRRLGAAGGLLRRGRPLHLEQRTEVRVRRARPRRDPQASSSGTEMAGLEKWTYPYVRVLIDEKLGELIGIWRQIAPVEEGDGSHYEIAGTGGSWFRYGGNYQWAWQRDFFDHANAGSDVPRDGEGRQAQRGDAAPHGAGLEDAGLGAAVRVRLVRDASEGRLSRCSRCASTCGLPVEARPPRISTARRSRWRSGARRTAASPCRSPSITSRPTAICRRRWCSLRRSPGARAGSRSRSPRCSCRCTIRSSSRSRWRCST